MFVSGRGGAQACLSPPPHPRLRSWAAAALTTEVGPLGSIIRLNCAPFHKGRGVGLNHTITLPPEEKSCLFWKAKPSLP